jgi:hypothetical protein
MFWKESKGLTDLSASSKVAITLFLILAGIGYLFGFLTIYTTYSPVDGEEGLSVEDIRLTFWGKRETTRLEKSIDGTMKEYFASEADYNATKEWIAAGAPRDEWESTIKPIFDVSCSTCHSEEAAVAGAVTETYEDVEEYLAMDTGKSPSRLVSLSHTHWLATLPVIFLLALIFSFTTYKEGIKVFVMAFSFLSVPVDIGSWWLAKLSPALSVLVILGGVALAISFLLLIVLSLYEMYIKKGSTA